MLKLDYTARERLEKSLNSRIGDLQAELESELSEASTNRVRGGIAELRRLLAELKPDQLVQESDPVSTVSRSGY